MALKTLITDGFGTGHKARVGHSSQMYVCEVPYDLPPVGSTNRVRYYAERLSLNGAGVSFDMNVNASVTSQEFSVMASSEYDIHIMKVIIWLEDESVVHSKLGNIDPATLTYGIDLIVRESGNDTYILRSAKKFADFIKQTAIEKPFGAGTDVMEISSTTGSDDAWCLVFDLGSLVPYGGLRIGYGTKDKIYCVLRDNYSALTGFDMRVLGYSHHSSLLPGGGLSHGH